MTNGQVIVAASILIGFFAVLTGLIVGFAWSSPTTSPTGGRTVTALRAAQIAALRRRDSPFRLPADRLQRRPATRADR
jgi:hypothetical protein